MGNPVSGEDAVPSTAPGPWPEAARRLHDSVLEQRPWVGSLDEFLPLYDRLPVATRSLLLHLHGEHDDAEYPYAYCVLCLPFGPPLVGKRPKCETCRGSGGDPRTIQTDDPESEFYGLATEPCEVCEGSGMRPFDIEAPSPIGRERQTP